jgi:hypothetical protein
VWDPELPLVFPEELRQAWETPEETRPASAEVFLAALAWPSESGVVSLEVPAPALASLAAWVRAASVSRGARVWVWARLSAWVAE